MTAAWSDADLDLVLAYVHLRSGLRFGDARRKEVMATVQAAARRAGAGTPQQLLHHLDGDGGARDALFADLTIGETYFFRDPSQLEVIRRELVPDLLRRGGEDRPLRVWSAGCASGEEPYSLAILLHEMGVGDRASILGTDLSRPRLLAAERARYTRWSLRSADAEQVRTYFRERGREFHLIPGIRERVRFAYLNLSDDLYPSLTSGIWGMDLVLCRNVLIYFDAATVERVARRLLAALRPEGWLVLGASDPPIAEMIPCETVVTEAGLAYRPAGAPAAPESIAPARAPAPPPAPLPLPPPPPPPPAPAPLAPPPALPPRRTGAGLAPVVPRPEGGEVDETVRRVRALADAGRLTEAGEAAGKALERWPQEVALHYLHAMLLLECGRAGEAVAAARRALYLDRGLALGHLLLGRAQARLGDSRGARRSLRTAAELLAGLPPGAPVPLGEGEPAARLAAAARAQLQLLEERTS